MNERRKSPRHDAEIEIEIHLDNLPIACTIVNRSDSGLLLRFDEGKPGHLSMNDVGKEILFECDEIPSFAGHTHRARIMRVTEAAGVGLMAVFILRG